MIGIVVVSHGKVAGELVNAARKIVGDVPAITAVSIGWTDDMAAARQKIEVRVQLRRPKEGAHILDGADAVTGNFAGKVFSNFVSTDVALCEGPRNRGQSSRS